MQKPLFSICRKPSRHHAVTKLILACLVFLLIHFFSSNPVIAEESETATTFVRTKPLWELHLFGSVARLPLYRGSDDYRTYTVPLAYIIYRGSLFQADRGGLRGILFRSDHLETTFSFYGNPPVDDDDTAREGMGDLDPIIEAGPALKWFFLGRHPRQYLYFRPAIRWTASIGLPDNLKTHHTGWRGLINLIYQYEPSWWDNRWRFGVNLGADFADRRYHRTFYEVPATFARPDRPRYKANGGFGGFSLAGSVSYRLTDYLSLILYGRWDALGEAVYQDSPLVEEENNLIGAVALNWRLYTSKKRVDARYQEQ